MNNPDTDKDVAQKDGYGNVTANNQDGQTEQEILDEAAAEDGDVTEQQEQDGGAGLGTYDIQFKCPTTIEASTPEEAHSLACKYWDEHKKRTTDELNIAVRLL